MLNQSQFNQKQIRHAEGYPTLAVTLHLHAAARLN